MARNLRTFFRLTSGGASIQAAMYFTRRKSARSSTIYLRPTVVSRKPASISTANKFPEDQGPMIVPDTPTNPVKEKVKAFDLNFHPYSDSKPETYTNALGETYAIGVNRNSKRYWVNLEKKELSVIEDKETGRSREMNAVEITEFDAILKAELAPRDRTSYEMFSELLAQLSYFGS